MKRPGPSTRCGFDGPWTVNSQLSSSLLVELPKKVHCASTVPHPLLLRFRPSSFAPDSTHCDSTRCLDLRSQGPGAEDRGGQRRLDRARGAEDQAGRNPRAPNRAASGEWTLGALGSGFWDVFGVGEDDDFLRLGRRDGEVLEVFVWVWSS